MNSNIDTSKGITYIWNDNAGLIGEDTSYLVCKTMVRVPFASPRIAKIISVDGKNLERTLFTENDSPTVTSQVYVKLTYQPYKDKQIEELKFTIPYKAALYSRGSGVINPEIKYIHGRQVGVYNILIEAVVALNDPINAKMREQEQNFFEKFNTRFVFSIDRDLPKAGEVLATQIRYTVQDKKIDGNSLALSGLQETRVMYVNEDSVGDKVITTKQVEPFVENIELVRELSNQASFAIINQTINSTLINSKDIVIKGSFALKIEDLALGQDVADTGKDESDTEFVPLMESPAKDQSEEVAEQVMEEIMDKHSTLEVAGEDLEILALEEAGDKGVEEEVEEKAFEEEAENLDAIPKEAEEEVASDVVENEEPEINSVSRPSKREKLSKHMRNLDKGVNSASETKAFRITNTTKRI